MEITSRMLIILLSIIASTPYFGREIIKIKSVIVVVHFLVLINKNFNFLDVGIESNI